MTILYTRHRYIHACIDIHTQIGVCVCVDVCMCEWSCIHCISSHFEIKTFCDLAVKWYILSPKKLTVLNKELHSLNGSILRHLNSHTASTNLTEMRSEDSPQYRPDPSTPPLPPVGQGGTFHSPTNWPTLMGQLEVPQPKEAPSRENGHQPTRTPRLPDSQHSKTISFSICYRETGLLFVDLCLVFSSSNQLFALAIEI